jgi:flagellar assembly factor FliW
MVYNFVKPMLGFEGLDSVEVTQVDDFFTTMKSVDNDGVSFTLINPFTIREYDIEIPDFCVKLLNIDKNSDVSLFNIMIVHSHIEDSTVNFLAPIIFNNENKQCMQVVLDNSRYPELGILESIKDYIGSSDEA